MTSIDSLSYGGFLQPITAPSFNTLEVLPVFKGFRKLQFTNGGVPALFGGISADVLTFQSFANAAISISTLAITYDGNGSIDTVDLSSSSKFNIQIATQTNQEIGTALAVTVIDGTGNTATISQPLPDNAGGVTISNAEYDFSFASFVGVNFAAIRSIRVMISNSVGSSTAGAINLASIQAI